MNTQLWRFSALAVLAACMACSKKDEAAGLANTDSGQAQAERAGSAGELHDASPGDLDALVDLMVAEAAELPWAEFDPAALAVQLGKNPQAHFEWVRDHTRWAPYRGLLRGSQGVMLDRVGSSLDRAVLLADLLRRSGHTVRLAHARLSEDRARELLGEVRASPGRPRSVSSLTRVTPERQGAIEAVIPGQKKSLQEALVNSKRLTAEAESLVRSEAEQLYAAVKGSASGDLDSDKLAIAALRDHWWVERQVDGRWIAMELMGPIGGATDSSVAAASTSEWRDGADFPSIPEMNWHTVQVRLVIERYQDGATQESVVLETSMRPAQLLGRPISLAHWPKPWPDTLPDPESDPNVLGNAAVHVKEWIPFLRIGDELVTQSGFTDGGEPIADPLNPGRDVAAAGGGGFMSGFGEALGGDAGVASSLTAEWIDYEVRVPGESPQRFRRPVFDLLGPAKRAAIDTQFDANTNERLIERYEALLSRTDILLQPCGFTAGFVSHLMSAGIVANQAAIRKLSQESDPEKAQSQALEITRKLNDWGPLMNLVRWRSALAGAHRDWFIDRPNILNYRITQSAVNADRVAVREMIDIASNPVGVHIDPSRAPFEVRLQQGVADTVAEVLALGADLRGTANAASLFAMTGGGPDRRLLIAPRDADAIGRLAWPEEVAARLGEHIEAGFVAVVPKEPVALNGRQRIGWWRVDPSTGETIGVMDNGYHTAAPEYTGVQLQRMRLAEWLWNPRRWREYQRLREMAMRNSFQMTDAEVAAYNMYAEVEFMIKRLLYLSWGYLI